MKLYAYLSRSRHGIFYFRWPLPRTDAFAARRTLRLSLGTRCPSEAGSLARYLAVCGETLIEHIGVPSMNYAELRSKAEQYFRASLAKGKLRRSEKGPFSDNEKERMEHPSSFVKCLTETIGT